MAQDARRVAEAVLPSVVLLVVEDANGQPLPQGSDFLARQGVVATSLRVMEGAHFGAAKVAGESELHEIAGVLAFDVERDIVLLSVPGVTAPVLTLADANRVAIGDPVYAAGNPVGLEGTISAGILSGVRQFNGHTLFQITASISPGGSGGPVLNVVGPRSYHQAARSPK